MYQVFDLLRAIEDAVERFLEQTGNIPSRVGVSREGYKYLVSLAALESRIGNLVIGCAPVRKIKTPKGVVEIVIDEMLRDEMVAIT